MTAFISGSGLNRRHPRSINRHELKVAKLNQIWSALIYGQERSPCREGMVCAGGGEAGLKEPVMDVRGHLPLQRPQHRNCYRVVLQTSVVQFARILGIWSSFKPRLIKVRLRD